MKLQKFFKSVITMIAPIIFVQSLFFKFSGASESVYIFTRVGMEPWGRYLTGAFELVAAILFFVPSWSWLGAFLAINIMIGAIFSHLTLLGIVVQNDSGLLFSMALVVFVSSLLKLHQVRYSVPLIGQLLKQSDDLAISHDPKFKAAVGHRLPVIIILSFAAMCGIGIIQQIISINQMLANQLSSMNEMKVAQWSYFMTLTSVFITFVLTLFVVRIFERPLHELVLVCQKISSGDRTTRSNLPLESEFGILSASMNKMLEEIQSKEADLNEKSLSIQRLLRVVIHDVANPLSVVSSTAQFATKNMSELSENQLKNWTRVTNASNKIEGIIKSTRDFEAVRSGIKKVELQKISVIKIIDSVIDLFQEKAKGKGISFSVILSSEVNNPEVLVEETLFTSSVISNIVSNAIKFSPENAGIEFVISNGDSNKIKISIIDHGVGLPKEMLDKFNQGGNIQSRVGTSGELGTGFGLDIARSIMKTMNGDLMIESITNEQSHNDHGTKVFLILPKA